jgi:hypothetical protein
VDKALFTFAEGLPASRTDTDYLDHATTIAIAASVGRSRADVWTSESSEQRSGANEEDSGLRARAVLIPARM